MNHNWILLIVCFCIAASYAANQRGVKRKRTSQQNLRIGYKNYPGMYAVAHKLTKTPLGIVNDAGYPLVNIIMHYAFDTDYVVHGEQIRKYHGSDGLTLFRNTISIVHAVDPRAILAYQGNTKPASIIVKHRKCISNKCIAEVAHDARGELFSWFLKWNLHLQPGETTLLFQQSPTPMGGF